MKRAAIFAVLALAWASPAFADTPLSAFFHETCLATNAQVEPLAALATAGGWRDMGPGPHNARGWEAPPVDGHVRRVAVWQEDVGGRPFQMCMAFMTGADTQTAEDLRTEFQLQEAEWREGRTNERVAVWFVNRDGRNDFFQVREVAGAQPHTAVSLGILIP